MSPTPAPPDVSDLHRPGVPGSWPTATGTSFAVRAPRASAVQLCLFDGADERRVPLERAADGLWRAHVTGVGAGQRYGYRVDGPWDPVAGDRFNPAKLLIDPCARALDGDVAWVPQIFGHRVDASFAGDGTVRDERDSAPYVPRSVVLDDAFDWQDDRAPGIPWERTVIYEGHVRGLTMRHPGVPAHLRGTYAGVANDAFTAHLRELGVTTLELLPVHAFTDEPHLVQLGLGNYWGYNTLSYFAPHPPYAADRDPLGAVAEFKGMVKALHRAGIEVVLDVVYNHTCEQGAASGATLSWRGFGAREHYRLDARGRDVDLTGCGNTLDFGDPLVVDLALDSLRYWVREMHVDGFRFDLAPALGRDGTGEFTPDHPFFAALRADPELSRVKLIAEPWDLGPHGWRTGQFPAPFADWNDHFRDTVRTFWLTDLAAETAGHAGAGVADLATRIAGSPDLFAARGPLASVNLVTCHDGFTLADLTAYDRKHNEANREEGRDGTGDNRTWNLGVEGPDAPAAVRTLRRRVRRGMLATLLLSTGVPMLLAGDETARSQRGNNNAYCQDTELSWLDWEWDDEQRALLRTTRFLVGLRQAHPVLRQRHFFPGDPLVDDARAALHWYGADGAVLTSAQWQERDRRTLQAVFDGTDVGDTRLLLAVNGSTHPRRFTLPEAGAAQWESLWDSRFESPEQTPAEVADAGATAELVGASVRIYRAADRPRAVRRSHHSPSRGSSSGTNP